MVAVPLAEAVAHYRTLGPAVELPAGAEMIVTFRAAMRSRQATRSSLAISGWRAASAEGGWS